MADAPKTYRGSSGHFTAFRGILPLLLLVTACGSSAADAGDQDATGGSPGVASPDPVEIRFEPEGAALRLRPRERIQVTAVIAPPSAYTVHFALLAAPDAAHDAVLTASEVVSDTLGRADVELVGPSAVTSGLTLRAQVAASTSEIPISVEPGGKLKLQVRARYSGTRTVTEWVVSVHPDRTCQSFGTELPDDSERPARIGPDETAILEHEDVTPEMAVSVRAGRFASGCVTLDGTVAIEGAVIVPIEDRPLLLEDTALDVAFQLEPDDATFGRSLDRGLALVAEAFRGGGASDVDALLDAMQSELASAQVAGFVTNREAAGWDALMLAEFSGAAALLSDTVGSWSRVGRGALLSARAFEGRLEGSDADAEQLAIERVGELAAGIVDFSVERSQWSADRADVIVFGGEFSWLQSELVAGLSEGPAVAETGALDVPSALSTVARCDALGAALFDASVTDFACDAGCLASACRNALGTMWARARSASGDARTRLSLAASGHAAVGEYAEATSLDGTWVGRLSTDGIDSEEETRGAAVGFAPKYAGRRAP